MRRRMESYVRKIGAGVYRQGKGLNTAVEVLVVEAVLVVPDALRWICYFVTKEPDPVIAWIGLVLRYCRACTRPNLDSWLHSHGCPGGRKRIAVTAAANRELPV